MKHIFGNLDVNDFFPGGRRNPLTQDHMDKAVQRIVNKKNIANKGSKKQLSVTTAVSKQSEKDRLSANSAKSAISKDSGQGSEKTGSSVPNSPRPLSKETTDEGLPLSAR